MNIPEHMDAIGLMIRLIIWSTCVFLAAIPSGLLIALAERLFGNPEKPWPPRVTLPAFFALTMTGTFLIRYLVFHSDLILK